MANFPLYQNRNADAITQLLARQGELAAQRAQQQGEIWGRAIEQVGQGVGQVLQQREQTKIQQERERRFNETLSGWDGTNDQAMMMSMVRLLGPSEGLKVAQGLIATKTAQQKQELDPKDFGAKIGALRALKDKMGGDYLQRNWSGVQPDLARYVKQFLGVEIGPEWKPEYAQALDTLDDRMNAKAGSEGFTLSPGQVRFDAAGKQLAAGPPKADEGPKVGTFEQYVQAKFGPNPTPQQIEQGRSTWAAVGREPDKPKEEPKPKPLLSGEVRAIQEFRAGLNAFDSIATAVGETGAGSKAGTLLPGFVTEVTGWGADSKSRQASLEAARQTIGKAMEGGVLRKEDEAKYNRMLPIISDPPEVATKKMANLKQRMLDDAESYLEVLEASGRDVSKIRGLMFGGQKFPAQGSNVSADEFLRRRGRSGTPGVPGGATVDVGSFIRGIRQGDR